MTKKPRSPRKPSPSRATTTAATEAQALQSVAQPEPGDEQHSLAHVHDLRSVAMLSLPPGLRALIGDETFNAMVARLGPWSCRWFCVPRARWSSWPCPWSPLIRTSWDRSLRPKSHRASRRQQPLPRHRQLRRQPPQQLRRPLLKRRASHAARPEPFTQVPPNYH